MDLEDLARVSLRKLGRDPAELLVALALSVRKDLKIEEAIKVAEGLLKDVEATDAYNGPFKPTKFGARAGEVGLGSRGLGDYLVHEVLTSMAQGGDAAVVGDVVLAVDGFHSRLSSVPLLMGFHATRAAIRDVMVTGAEPIATLVDVHVADDTDISFVIDVTVGAKVASESAGARLVGGSTLRIGGDAVIGERVTGGAFAAGKRVVEWSRFNARPGDVLCATVGKGGGTVTAFALTHGMYDLIELTINMDFVAQISKAFGLTHVKGAFDWTNGGIVLDAWEISQKLKVRITLYDTVYKAVHPKLLKAFTEHGVDPLRASTDSIVFISERCKGLDAIEVGVVERGEGVWLEDKPLAPDFRESPYTHVKKAVETLPKKHVKLEELIEYAKERETLLKRVLTGSSKDGRVR